MPKSKSKAKSTTDVQEYQRGPFRCSCTRVPVMPKPSEEMPPKGPSKLRSVVRKLSILKKLIPKRLFKAKPKGTTTHVPATPSRFALLPMELLLEIAKYADPVSTACLRATNRYFRDVVPRQPLNKCAQALVIARIESGMEVLPRDLICILCKRTCPREFFCPTMWDIWRDCAEFNRCFGLLDRKPSARFCVFHVYQQIDHRPWDMTQKRTCVNNELGWQRMARMCTHCSREYDGPGGCVCGCEICEFEWQPLFDRCMQWHVKTPFDNSRGRRT